MQNKKEVLNFLGLAQRAGKITIGYDKVKIIIKRKKTNVVVLASDSSDNTKDKIISLINHYPEINLIEDFSSSELNSILGKNIKLLAINDLGFGQALIKKINKGE